MKLYFIILLFLPTLLFSQPWPAYRDTVQKVQLTFNELMSTDRLFDKENYVVYSEIGDTLYIFGIGMPEGVDTTGGVDYVILVTKPFEYNLYYTVKVSWVKDRAGNLIAENNFAFTILPMIDPDRIPPNVYITPEDFTVGQLQIDTVWASGQQDQNHTPNKAIDGFAFSTPGSDYDFNTWTSCCINDPGGQWFIAGFDDERFIHSLSVSTTYFNSGRSYKLRIEISEDSQNWEAIQTVDTVPNEEWLTVIIGRAGKYIRIVFVENSQSDWAGLWEIYVIGN